LEWNSTCFGQFLCPSSGVFHCTHSNGICQTGLLTSKPVWHTALFTMENSWWWTEELSETCRVSFSKWNCEKLVHLVGSVIGNCCNSVCMNNVLQYHVFGMNQDRGAQILGARLSHRQWHLIFVSPHYSVCFMSPSWCLGFWGNAWTFRKFLQPCT
jgi:hypothetical protein